MSCFTCTRAMYFFFLNMIWRFICVDSCNAWVLVYTSVKYPILWPKHNYIYLVSCLWEFSCLRFFSITEKKAVVNNACFLVHMCGSLWNCWISSKCIFKFIKMSKFHIRCTIYTQNMSECKLSFLQIFTNVCTVRLLNGY